ncbi:MAG: hypothetical protein AAGC77_01800 [Pseudomonadota bacterium]
MNRRAFATGLIALTAAPNAAHAKWRAADADALQRAAAHAPFGSTIALARGAYDIADLQLPRSLTLKGEPGTVLYSSRQVVKGLLNPLPGASLRVQNIKFKNAASPDSNGAGIRHDGRDLTIIDCVFEQNENGVLATGEEAGSIIIRRSAFLRNGAGDGYSHGIYAARGAVLDIGDSRFEATKIGHHIKSLAARTRIVDCVLDDANGRTSYAVDASRGGDVAIIDSTLIQSANGDNRSLINYDLSRGGQARQLLLVHNTIINYRKNGALLRNGTGLIPTLIDNDIRNESGGRFSVPHNDRS